MLDVNLVMWGLMC